jgi:DNA polymerase I
MPTLYLIDGYAQFFRAYHAIRTPMTSPVTKEPTNMTFGFVGMMLKLLKADPKASPNLAAAGSPDYIAVTIDVSGDKETFRSEIYPEYKANRTEPPNDLFPQVDRCVKMLREIGVPVLGLEGFEADDVIATLVTSLRAKHPDLKIRIVSKDKDLKQLLTNGNPTVREGSSDDTTASPSLTAGFPSSTVELFDIHTDTPISAATLMQESGLRPDQIIDMLTLMGDAVDNVPGVEGVGEKTAAMLLQQYGTLDNLLAHADEIKGKRGEKLREAMPRLPLSKQLVSLRHDAPVALNLDDATTKNFDLPKLIPILKELGFNRYQDDVRAMLTPAQLATLPPDLAGTKTDVPNAAQLNMPGLPAPAEGAGKSKERKPSLQSPSLFADGPSLFDQSPSLGSTATPLITAQSGSYRCITTREQLDALVRALRTADIIAIDTETTSLSPHDAKLCGISIATTPGEGVYIPVRSPTPDQHLDERTVLDTLRPILEDPTRPKCGHNLKYDLLIFRAHGVNLAMGPAGFDSMVASYLIDASRSSHSLDNLALSLLNRTNISITQLIGSGKDQRTFDTVPIDIATQYAAEDADVALQLRNLMLPQLQAMGEGAMALFTNVEMPLVEVLAELEWNGILVDPAELDRQRHRLQGTIDTILAKLNAESKAALGRTFDPDSPKQLSVVLFNAPDADVPGLGIKPIKKTKTGFSTDAEVLEKLGQDDSITTPIPALILEYRELSKLVSTYLIALKDAINAKTGRIHSSFHQTVAATGRLASSDPNLQNIPIRTDVGREIRRAFLAPPGCVLVTADYSQIELRLLAHLSRDPALIQAFHEDQDIHTAVAAQIHGVPLDKVTREQRSGAKMVNFGIVYGITSYGLSRRLNIPERDAAVIINDYKRKFSGITTFLQECIEHARSKGYVETILHRRRPIPDIDSNIPTRRALAERLSINSVVQGSAADLIKVAMVDIYHSLEQKRARKEASNHPSQLLSLITPESSRIDSTTLPHGHVSDFPGLRMLLQIHDELVFECPEPLAEAAKKFIATRMEQAMTLSVPLKADAHIGRNWFEGK